MDNTAPVDETQQAEDIDSSEKVEESETASSEDTKTDTKDNDKNETNQNGDSNEKSAESEESDDKTENAAKNQVPEAIDKPERITRGIKRKAAHVEPTNSVQKTETTEQKENVDLKNSENVPDDSPSKDSSLKSLSDTDSMGKGKRARIPNKRYSDIAITPNRKNTSNQKLSDGSDQETPLKEDPVEPPVSISSPPLPYKKQRFAAVKENLQDSKYLKPFKFGWKRELVWRSTSTTLKPIGDIYYYTPTGKKIRSFRELSDHLTGNSKNLTIENFSYTKEPLGLDDPEKEIIRDAKVKTAEGVSESPTAKKVDALKKPKKILSPKVVATESPKVEAEPPVKVKAVDPPPVTKNPASATKKTKMPVKKTKYTPAKKAKTTIPKTDELMEVDPSPARASPSKTRNNQNSVTKLAKQRNLKLRSITNSNANSEDSEENKFMENYFQNLSFGYNTLLYVFQYLKVQDLLRSGCVCTMWRDIASHPSLWRTVRMKNSQVHCFEGLANTLKKHGTVHLDLRKMLLPSNGDEIWPEFSRAIARVTTLKKIELCRCPASVVENLAVSNPELEVINAVTIKCENVNLDPLKSLTCIKELRLKSTSGLNIASVDSLKELKTLRHLSLTSVNELHNLNLKVIAELKNLESLDLGECTDFPIDFGRDILSQLEKLEKLRLEKGQGNCYIFEILEAVKDMKKLEQLELVNFDVKAGFDKALGACTNIKKLMIIPTYISQSATTNNMMLSGVLRLKGSLTHFVWGVTLELLRVTELFVDQCEEPKDKKDKKPTGNGDSIPVLKPVPDLSHGGVIQSPNNPPQVEILPLPNLQKLLLNSLPTTRVKILKIPFHATWRQTLTDSV